MKNVKLKIKLILIIFLILIVLPIFANAQSNQFLNNLMSYYKFDNSNPFVDSQGLYNGTNIGTTSITGKINEARNYYLPSGQYIYLQNYSFIGLSSNSTQNFWLMRNSTSGEQHFLSSRFSDNTDSPILNAFITNSFYSYFTSGISGYTCSLGGYSLSLSTGTWYMITIVRNVTHLSLYVDGVLNTSTTCGNQTLFYMNSTNNIINFGNRPLISSRLWYGRIDEVGIWNRSMTSSEVASLYNSGAGLSYDSFTYVTPSIQCFLNISTAGIYNLSSSNNGTSCVNITTNNVIINGNGYTINGNILMQNYSNLTINYTNVNGTINISKIAGETHGWGGNITIINSTILVIDNSGAMRSGNIGERAGITTATDSVIGTLISRGGLTTYPFSANSYGGTALLTNTSVNVVDLRGGDTPNTATSNGVGGNLTFINSNLNLSNISINLSGGTGSVNRALSGFLTLNSSSFSNTNGTIKLNYTKSNLTNINQFIIIKNNNAFLDSSSYPEYNSSANITLNSLNLTNPIILKDGTPCTSGCTLYSYNGSTAFFGVTGWTNYSLTNSSWIFLNQTPSNLSTTTFGLLTINYNITNNVSGVYLNYTITNSTSYVNNTPLSTYNQRNSTNTSSEIWRTLLNDNNYFPAVYNYDESIQEATQKTGFFNLSTNNDYAVVSFINIRNDTPYNIFEVMMNTSTSGLAEIYYCNNSYTTGDVSVNNNCILMGNFNGAGFNHTHNPALNYSSHNLFSFPMLNGNIGGVKVSNESFFVIKRTAGEVYVYYNNLTSPRSDAFRTSNDSGSTFTSYTNNFIDSHVHQYTGFNYFQYQSCGNGTSGIFCSGFQSDLIDLSSLNPTSPQIHSPTNQDYYYNNSVLLNFTRSLPFSNSTKINNYTLSLLNPDLTLNNSLPFYLNRLFYTSPSFVSTTNTNYETAKSLSMNAFVSNVTATLSNSDGTRTAYQIVTFTYADGTSYTTPEQTTTSDTPVTKYYNNPAPLKEVTLISVAQKIQLGGTTYTGNFMGYGGNLTAFYLNWNLSSVKTGNYILRMGVSDSNGLQNFGLSNPFNVTSNINIQVKNNYTGAFLTNYSGWIYNYDTGWNQTFNPSGNLSTLSIYNGLNTIFVTHPDYSVTSANYLNITLNNTPQTINQVFNIFGVNSVYVAVFDADTDAFINDNSSVIVLRSGNYYNSSNTTNGTILFSELPPDSYLLSVTHVGYATSTYSVVVYNLSTQIVNARLSTSNTSIGVFTKNQLYQGIPNVLITQQRQRLGGSWVTINQVFSDVNGFANLAVQEGLNYRFILSAGGFVTKQFELAMYSVLSPYTFVLTPTTTNIYTNYWAGVNYYYSPTETFLNQSIYNFSITTYNSSLDIAWTSVLVNGTRVNVTGSPAGSTASINLDLTNYEGALPVVYSFYFYNTEFEEYFEFRIPVTYFVNSLEVTQTSMPEVWNNFKNDIQTGSPTGRVWTTIIAMFLILAIVITLIQLSGNQVLGLVGGIAGLGFFAYVGWLNPIFAILSGLLAAILLFMNRG